MKRYMTGTVGLMRAYQLAVGTPLMETVQLLEHFPCIHLYLYMNNYNYIDNGTSLLQTPLGPHDILIKEVSLF